MAKPDEKDEEVLLTSSDSEDEENGIGKVFSGKKPVYNIFKGFHISGIAKPKPSPEVVKTPDSSHEQTSVSHEQHDVYEVRQTEEEAENIDSERIFDPKVSGSIEEDVVQGEGENEPETTISLSDYSVIGHDDMSISNNGLKERQIGENKICAGVEFDGTQQVEAEQISKVKAQEKEAEPESSDEEFHDCQEDNLDSSTAGSSISTVESEMPEIIQSVPDTSFSSENLSFEVLSYISESSSVSDGFHSPRSYFKQLGNQERDSEEKARIDQKDITDEKEPEIQLRKKAGVIEDEAEENVNNKTTSTEENQRHDLMKLFENKAEATKSDSHVSDALKQLTDAEGKLQPEVTDQPESVDATVADINTQDLPPEIGPKSLAAMEVQKSLAQGETSQNKDNEGRDVRSDQFEEECSKTSYLEKTEEKVTIIENLTSLADPKEQTDEGEQPFFTSALGIDEENENHLLKMPTSSTTSRPDRFQRQQESFISVENTLESEQASQGFTEVISSITSQDTVMDDRNTDDLPPRIGPKSITAIEVQKSLAPESMPQKTFRPDEPVCPETPQRSENQPLGAFPGGYSYPQQYVPRYYQPAMYQSQEHMQYVYGSAQKWHFWHQQHFGRQPRAAPPPPFYANQQSSATFQHTGKQNQNEKEGKVSGEYSLNPEAEFTDKREFKATSKDKTVFAGTVQEPDKNDPLKHKSEGVKESRPGHFVPQEADPSQITKQNKSVPDNNTAKAGKGFGRPKTRKSPPTAVEKKGSKQSLEEVKIEKRANKTSKATEQQPVEEIEDEAHSPMFVEGLSPSTNLSDLINYVEIVTKKDVVEDKVIQNYMKTAAVVVLKGKPDIDAVRQSISHRTIDGVHPKVMLIKPPTSIAVSFVEEKKVSDDTLVLFFEKYKDIVVGTPQEVEDGSCRIITFTEPEAVERFCSQEHLEVANVCLLVTPCYQCELGQLWDSNTHKVVIPDTLLIPQAKGVLQILQMECCEDLRKELEGQYCELSFTQTQMCIACTLHPTVSGFKELCKTWTERISKYVRDYVSNNVEEKADIECPATEIWDELQAYCSSVGTEKCLVMCEDDWRVIQIVGITGHVDDIYKGISEKKSELEKQLHRTTVQLFLPWLLIKLMENQGTFEKLQREDFKISHDKGTIYMEGLPEDITAAKLSILETQGKTEKISFCHNLSTECVSFVSERPEIHAVMAQDFHQGNIEAEWTIHQANVEAYAFRLEEISDYTYASISNMEQQFKSIFYNNVTERTVKLSPADSCLLRESKEWEILQEELTETHDTYADWQVEDDIHVYGQKKNVDIIVSCIEDFLTDFSIRKVSLRKGTIEVKFIRSHMFNLVQELESKLKKHEVSIRPENDTIHISGRKEGLDEAKQRIEELCQSIVHEDFTFEKVAVKDVFHDESKTGVIDATERETKCVIQLPGEKETHKIENLYEELEPGAVGGQTGQVINPETSRTTDTSSRPKSLHINGMQIGIVEGEIGDQKSDVVVVSCSTKLDLKAGASSRSVLNAAGQNLQDELHKKYPEGIEQGTIAEGSQCHGRSAQFKKVYVTALPSWNPTCTQTDVKQVLYKFMTNCLDKAVSDSATSIHFSALGCGQLKYPHHVVAEQMFQATVDFAKKKRHSNLKDVTFVLYKKDLNVIQAFKEELKMRLDGSGPRKVHELKRGVVTIKVEVAALADQQVDALVCTTTSKMEMTSGACKSLLEKGGPTLTQECTTKYKNSLEPGNVVEISPGKLSCKTLMLTVLPKYSEEGIKALTKVFNTCLELADAKGYKSIAFPALGTGNLKYPGREVSKCMFETATEWGLKKKAKSLHVIKFVLYARNHDLVQHFTNTALRGQRERGEHSQLEVVGGRQYSVFVDGVCVKGVYLRVYKGNLLDYPADAICITVGQDFMLNGALATALVKKCPKVADVAKCKKTDLNKKDVVKSGGFGLKCRKIFYIKYGESLSDWKKKMKKLLEKADREQMRQLALPSIGASKAYHSFKPECIAGCIFDALNNMATPQHLKELHIIVFSKQPESYTPIMEELHKKVQSAVVGGKPGKCREFFSDVVSFAKETLFQEGKFAKDEFEARKKMKSCVTVTIYSNSKEKIADCKNKLKSKLDEAYVKKRIEDYKEVVKSLTVNERAQLDVQCLVNINIDENSGIVTIDGPKHTVVNALDQVEQRLRKIWQYRIDRNDAETLKDLVRWKYEELTEEDYILRPYSDMLNLQIERAFTKGEKTFSFDDSGKEYIIDFEMLKEYPRFDPDDSLRVVRKDILKSERVTLPEEWTKMKDNENVKVVEMRKGDAKYKEIEQRFLHEVKTGQYKDRVHFSMDPTKVVVTKIQRVQNKSLYWQFETKKIQMKKQKPDLPQNMPLERSLWHGTNKDAIDSIVENGFNRSYSGENAGKPWYGDGVYFAKDASYSMRSWMTKVDSKGSEAQLFIVRVLTGHYCKGQKGMRVLPSVDPSDPAKKQVLFDSAVDDEKNPFEFCIFHDTQAYPEFIVTFKQS